MKKTVLINSSKINYERKKLCRSVFFDAPNPPRTILVTSSLSGEGVTTVSVNLAKSIAEEHSGKILLIDGNIYNPSILNIFNLPDKSGLYDFIYSNSSLHESVQSSSSISNLYIMGLGRTELESFTFEKMGDIKRLIEQSKKEFDFIIFDAPSILECSETPLITRYFDNILLIIQAHKTIIADVEKAKNEIVNAGGKIKGIILNRRKQYVPQKIHNKYFGHD